MPRSVEEQEAVRAEYTKRWRERNKERYRATQNAARARTYSEWYIRNRAAKLSHNENRRARLVDAFVENVSLAILFERDKGICGICGLTLTLEEATMDHIVALANGGKHSYVNTQIAHGLCNSTKGANDA